MDDYISRQAAVELCLEYNGVGWVWSKILDGLKEMPSADVQPVRYGKWERHYIRPGVFANLYWHCSCCGGKLADEFANHYKYCPDCGARMDGEQDG